MIRQMWKALIVALVCLTPGAWSDDHEKVELKVGDEAPNFKLPKAEGEQPEDAPKQLSDFKGKKSVVLAFYPKADTPGCTKQLCGYRDDFAQFKSKDTEVIAISTDQQEASNAFKEKFEMPFMVLGDHERSIVKSYGVPLAERGDLAFAQRSIFLIGKDGKIKYIDREYNIADDKAPLYEAIGIEVPEEKKES